MRRGRRRNLVGGKRRLLGFEEAWLLSAGRELSRSRRMRVVEVEGATTKEEKE